MSSLEHQTNQLPLISYRSKGTLRHQGNPTSKAKKTTQGRFAATLGFLSSRNYVLHSYQLRQRRFVRQELRPARGIVDGRVRRDAQVVVDRGEDFAVASRAAARRIRPGGWWQPMTWPVRMPPPAMQAAADLRPVIAARLLVDARRAAELAPARPPSRRSACRARRGLRSRR